MKVTAFYAGLLALLYVGLSLRTIVYRRGKRVSLGEGGDPELQRRVRVHGNFGEYAPLALILMGLAESLGLIAPALHVLGLGLLAGRLSHAYALSQTPQSLTLRTIGMAVTLTVIILGAIACLGLSFRAMTAI